ncbi:hypothetical protein FMEXI_11255 [Fusarium mexicanum]|uniref:Uncharacterized protein n=1 Tax=Fusarium mexicanum TaxID=751941 RepID=A0A8H5MNF4_9HYPO|nr:hypothetical protein FMEXI_11255 [Fusarium mexicanum]
MDSDPAPNFIHPQHSTFNYTTADSYSVPGDLQRNLPKSSNSIPILKSNLNMRFFSILSTMTLVASVMGAAIPAPVEENTIEVKRAEAHEDAGLQKRDEGYGDGCARKRNC